MMRGIWTPDDLRHFQESDDHFWRVLVREYDGVVRPIARRWARGVRTTDDNLVSDVWSHVWERRRQYRGTGAFGAWLRRVAHSECSNQCRARRRFERVTDCVDPFLCDEVFASPPAEESVSEAAREARLQWFREHRSHLPPRQGQAIELRCDGGELAGIAGVMDCEPNTVSGYLTRAIRSLRGEVAAPSAATREELGLEP
jgi:RNA polymerase sigma factor (sigma-70 family)